MTGYQSNTIRLAEQQIHCSLVQDLLPLYMEGEVSGNSKELIADHLAHCEHCRGFLAGAQSVRNQLRQQTTQRQVVVQQQQPAQRAVGWGRILLLGAVTLGALLSGGLATMLLGLSLHEGEIELFFGGAGMGLFALLLFWFLARSRGPLTVPRVLGFLGSCAIGLFGALLWAAAESPIGLPFILCSLFGIWLVVWNSRSMNTTAASYIPGTAQLPSMSRAQLARGLGWLLLGLGGLGLMLMLGLSFNSWDSALIPMLLLLAAGMWLRDQSR